MRKLFLLLSFVFFVGHASAALNLELTRGIKAPIPIAVLSFSSDDDVFQPDTSVGDVIRADLNNSGRFQVSDNQGFDQLPHDATTVNFSYWQKFRLNALVVGKVEKLDKDEYEVSFALVNLFKSTSEGNHQAEKAQSDEVVPENNPATVDSSLMIDRLSGQVQVGHPSENKKSKISAPAGTTTTHINQVLIEKSWTVSGKQLRQIAHEISDSIYQQLTGQPGFFTTHIAYVLAEKEPMLYKLQVADYDGFNARTLAASSDPIMTPAWSSSGQELAYVSFNQKGDPAIYKINVMTKARQLLSSVAGLNAAPAWSPDGQQLALVLTKTGTAKLYILDIATKQITPLTTGAGVDTEPAWLPDGQHVLFTSNRGGTPQIYQIDVATKTVTPVTISGEYNAAPSVSKDGKILAMLHGEGHFYNIAMKSLVSNESTLLTDSGLVTALTFAPNNNLIMYSTSNNGRQILAVTSVDGTTNYALPANQFGDMREPAWGEYQ